MHTWFWFCFSKGSTFEKFFDMPANCSTKVLNQTCFLMLLTQQTREEGKCVTAAKMLLQVSLCLFRYIYITIFKVVSCILFNEKCDLAVIDIFLLHQKRVTSKGRNCGQSLITLLRILVT